MSVATPRILETVQSLNTFDATACMNCGICSAVCPLGLEHLPRQLFRYVVLGLDDALKAQADTVFSCLLCGLCEENCPAGVHIVENMRALRHYFHRAVFAAGSERG